MPITQLSKTEAYSRISLIGNSVCIPQVQAAYNQLINRAENLKLNKNSLIDKNKTFVNGCCLLGKLPNELKKFKPVLNQKKYNLIIDPTVIPKPLKTRLQPKAVILTNVEKRKLFLTPVFSRKVPSQLLTERSMHDQSTALCLEINTTN